MSKTIIKKTFNFGKVAYRGNRRTYPAKVELELEDGGRGLELSICGAIYTPFGRMVSGGQNLDEMLEFLAESPTFRRLHDIWKKYHLNGLNAGTVRQQSALEKAGITNYDAACDYLKSIGLYVDTLAENEHLMCETERANRKHFEYGYGWILRDIPAAALDEIYNLCGIDTRKAA